MWLTIRQMKPWIIIWNSTWIEPEPYIYEHVGYIFILNWEASSSINYICIIIDNHVVAYYKQIDSTGRTFIGLLITSIHIHIVGVLSFSTSTATHTALSTKPITNYEYICFDTYGICASHYMRFSKKKTKYWSFL